MVAKRKRGKSAVGETGPKKCFVVMPFGRKPLCDGSGRMYDFDKVYRVIMQRAIRQAGLEPIRADERKGANIIHTDMFKDLRDQSVVLADLSLENPNVFYELGIRHVMSSKGTVLMCRAESELPFDVKLSRVIFYEYDGQSLDWEEVERVVREVQLALGEAVSGVPDSPVHALLERVFPESESVAAGGEPLADDWPGRGEPLEPYHEIVARHWKAEGAEISELVKTHGQCVFGARALALLCLLGDELPPEAEAIADDLYNLEQYGQAAQLYGRLVSAGRGTVSTLIRCASTISEIHRTIQGVDEAMGYLDRARRAAMREDADEKAPQFRDDVAHCLSAIAGMSLWRWELTKSDEDLQTAIQRHREAQEAAEAGRAANGQFPVGRLALIHLRLLLLLRERDGHVDRPDLERHREAILALQPADDFDPRSPGAEHVSYLRWYQAIALADQGNEDKSRKMALVAYSEDGKIVGQCTGTDVGRRQYTHQRRLLEHHAHVLRNPSLIGHIAQLLLTGHSSPR